jgi:EmrB/QacA subfamily drug resistance transporter
MQLQPPDPLRWKALALLCAAQFIVILDTSIIGVALPTIQTALDFTPEGLSWIFNAYVIAFGGLLLLGGRLSDLLGHRKVFMAGFLTLSLASLLAGIAPNREVLIAGRALQGVGAAMIAPSALSILMTLFAARPAELGKAFGFWGAAAAAGGTAGVFLGGVITEWLDWRWTFLINLPLGASVYLLSPLVLRPFAATKGKVDLLGAGLVTSALVLGVWAIITAETVGWASFATVGSLALAGALLAIFVLVQAKRSEPLVPLGIFRAPNLSAGNVVTALLAASWIPLWFFLNLYLQQILGLTALQAGLALVPMTVTIMVLMVGVTGRLIARFGFKSNLVLGLFLLAASLVWLAQAPADGSFLLDVLPASLLAALGMSLAYIPATIAGMSGARPEETGLASGLINTTYQVGSALGLAATVAVSAAQTAAADGALLEGFSSAFLWSAGIAAVGGLLAQIAVRSPKTSALNPEAASL